MGQTKMGLSDTTEIINEILDKVRTTLIEKSGDYGNAWQNPAMFGEMSAMDSLWSRLSDKVARLQSLTRGREPTYESVGDTLLDIMGYTTLIMTMLEMESQTIADITKMPAMGDRGWLTCDDCMEYKADVAEGECPHGRYFYGTATHATICDACSNLRCDAL